ncbi:MAG TPA: endonuclease III [Myxococcota bacterium]|nr:endonuclease III [Myxococcota bacterium]
MPTESHQARRARAGRIAKRLARAYPDARCALAHRNAFELLIATILSAQCTDAKVNEVTAQLFPKYPTPKALASADPADVEAIVRPTGFYRQKTKSIQAAAAGIVADFGGEVPRALDALVTLRGVARKTANVVRGVAFGEPGLAIDTHMQRVNRRLALTRSEEPDEIERELAALLAPREWTPYTLRVIHHGRVCCTAQRPRCGACPIAAECPSAGRIEPERAGARVARARRAR